jgi:riboflavin kinase / FMN adenylyltransferase
MNALSILQELHYRASWAAVGAFDGVHRGHQVLFSHLVNRARLAGLPALAITFDPLPGAFFNPQPGGFSISSLEERLTLIRELGVEKVIVLPFTQALANIEALEFMQELKGSLGLEKLFAGFNFTLGHDRTGTVETLGRIGKAVGFTVEIEPPVLVEGQIVSSSAIRSLLRQGSVRLAADYLGRRFTLNGEVVHGEHRGGKLGIPTANLALPADRLLPANGVYATRAVINGKSYDAVTNIGVRPTFENPLPQPRVEPHLLDTHEDFYEQAIKLEFLEYLRPEMKFPDGQSLVAQIQLDIARAREIFANEP